MGAREPIRGIIRRTTGVVAATNAVVTLGGSMSGLQWEMGGTSTSQKFPKIRTWKSMYLRATTMVTEG
jgi:hypothetical protein